MSLLNFIFYFLEAVAALSAVSMIFTRNVFYGALLLITCLIALAGLYILAFAEFIAVTQILIYAGGILVVIIFGIMLTSKISGKPLVVEHANLFSGILAGFSFFGLLIYFLSAQKFNVFSTAKPSPETRLRSFGTGLMSDFILPFEIAGVMLLIALIGAAVISSSTKSKKV
ncbi:MAG: NADH-quinone oxidoreductase subunit J [Chryseolinea sp.]